MTTGSYYFCNTCNVTPIEGPRFHCNVCADYDECGKCRAASPSAHDASHTWSEHFEPKMSLATDLGYTLSLLNTCSKNFGHSVPYGPDKRSAVFVEELVLTDAPMCAFVCMSASMGISGLSDDVARVEYILDKVKTLRRNFPGGKHTPCCRLGLDDTAVDDEKQCPRCWLEMRVWTIILRVSYFRFEEDFLALFLAAEKKFSDDPDPRFRGMVSDGSFTADALLKAWDEATTDEKEAILARKKGITEHLETTYQWPLDLDAESVQ